MRVLVVDPDADNRLSWDFFLRCLGHRVAVAPDTPSAKLQSQTFCPEVVLTELVLPSGDGGQLARWFREQESGCGILLVAVTWLASREDRSRSEQAGFDYFFFHEEGLGTVQACPK